MTSKMIEGTCPICKCEIKPAKNQGQFNRNLGWHKLKQHGVHGQTATPEGKRSLARRRHWANAGMTPKEIEAREAEFLKAHPPEEHVPRQQSERMARPKVAIEPMKLDHCPYCEARFYGSQSERNQ